MEQYKEDILQRYYANESLESISKAYNTYRGAITRWIEKWGCELRKPPRNKRRSSDGKLAGLEFEFDAGKSIYAIAKERDIGKHLISRYLKQKGRDTLRGSTLKDSVPLANFTDEILQEYISGVIPSRLAEKYNCSVTSICTFVAQHGIELRPRPRYNLNHNYFNKIDTADKAYLLGWFYADGFVTQELKRWCINICDYNMLEHIRNMVEYGGPLHECKKYKENHKDKWALSVSSEQMCADLVKLGCVPAKSLILGHPTLEQVPTTLLSHFYRGIFEGDGNIFNVKTNIQRCHVSIIGNNLLLDQMAFNLQQINIDIRTAIKQKSTIVINFRNKQSQKTFLDFIYTSAPCCLGRKYQKYVQFCEANGWEPIGQGTIQQF